MYPKDRAYTQPSNSHDHDTRSRSQEVQNPYVVTITTIMRIMMSDKSITKEESKKYISQLRQQLDSWEKQMSPTPDKRKGDDKPEPPKKKRKNPSTPYELFCDEKRDELKRLEPDITEQEISARLRIWWREISDLEAQRYIRLSEDRKTTPGTIPDPYTLYQPYSYNYPPSGVQSASHQSAYPQEYSQVYPASSTYAGDYYLQTSGQNYPYSGQSGVEKRY